MVAIVMNRSAKMPGSFCGNYRHVAVVDVPYWLAADKSWEPKMISDHARNVYRVLWHSGPVNVGTSSRCAFARAMAYAASQALAYNSAGDMAEAEQIIGTGGSA